MTINRIVGALATLGLALIWSSNVWAEEETAPAEQTEAAQTTEVAGPAQTEEKVEAVVAPEAKLARLEGSAELMGPADTGFQPVSAGASLPVSGALRVLPGSKAHVELANGATVFFKEFSIVRFNELSKDTYTEMTVTFGEFMIGLKTPSPGSQEGRAFKVVTPAATADIRGSVTWGRVNADLSARFGALKGALMLDAAGKTVEVGEDKSSETRFREAPDEPMTTMVDNAQTFAIEGSLEGLPETPEKN